MSHTTAPQFDAESVADAVTSVAAICDAPTVVTLTATGTTIAARREPGSR